MAAKQARRRKPRRKTPNVVLQLPRRAVRVMTTAAVVAVALTAAGALTRAAFDVPITGLTIDAEYQRVSSLQLTEAASDAIDGGFLTVRLDRIRESIEALEWVDTVSVRRVWPDQLHIVVFEQKPAARWGEGGLLNTRGELFVESARHQLEELPRLAGPANEVHTVAAQYLALRGPLIEAGLGLSAVTLSERGAWKVVLGNGIEVRLGRQQTDDRVDRFLSVAAPVVARHESRIRYVDMRYSNGFSIGWKKPEYRRDVHAEAAARAAALQGNR
ncbi:MAG: cell division protein FtsQ/DivIB [Pseudomonadota bacterium]